MTTNNPLLINISEAFAKGNRAFIADYLADDVRWTILGNSPITGKEQVLDVLEMQQLESFPVVTIKNIVAAGHYVVIESTGEAKTKKGNPYNQTYCDVFKFNGEVLKEVTTYLDTALSNQTDL
jgi:uncharacterized protein